MTGPLPPSIAALKNRKGEAKPITIAERQARIDRARELMGQLGFAGIVVPYPTLAEIGKRAAMDFFTPSLTSLWVRRIIAWLRVFG